MRDLGKIAILIPCFNEEITIKKVIEDFFRECPQADIYVYDNNSTDNTARIALEAGARVVSSPLQGKGFVVQHMFRDIVADIYVMVDGDDTYPASSLKMLLDVYQKSNASMVVGNRLMQFENNSFRPFHRFGNWLVAILIRKLFKTNLKDIMSGYRVFSKEFVKTIPLTSRGFEIETEMSLQALMYQYMIAEAPINYGVRPKGSESKLNTYSDGCLVISSIFLLFKNYKPLLFYAIFAAVFALISFILGFYPVMEYIQFSYVKKVPTAILATGFALLSSISLGVGLVLDTVVRLNMENFQLNRKQINHNR